MTYTRKPREPRTVTFTVSWIEEEITLHPFGDSSREAMAGLAEMHHEPLLLELPIELRRLIEDCSADEFNEFIESWSEASLDHKAETDLMRERFKNVTKMMVEGFKQADS